MPPAAGAPPRPSSGDTGMTAGCWQATTRAAVTSDQRVPGNLGGPDVRSVTKNRYHVRSRAGITHSRTGIWSDSFGGRRDTTGRPPDGVRTYACGAAVMTHKRKT